MKSTFAAVAFSLVAAVSASPPGCHPNFQGVATTIVSGAVKWGLAPGGSHATTPVLSLPDDKVPDFRFEFSGRPSGSYVVRAIHFQGENLVVTDSGAATLDLSAETVTNTKEFWLLDCQTCGTNPFTPGQQYASGCTIRPEDPAAGVCVELAAEGSPIALGPCTGASGQLFDFWVPS